MAYVVHILVLIGIYVILSLSLNLIVGYAGLFSVAHAAFYGIGAYVAALMSLQLHSSFPVNVICAIIVGGLMGALVGFPSLRLRDDYLVVATFAFQVVAFDVLNNWTSFTGGPMGLSAIPRLTVFGLNMSSPMAFLLSVVTCCILAICLTRRIVNSPFGRVLKGIREDEVFTKAAGKNVAIFKVLVFALGAGMASVGGVMYTYYIRFIDPTSFTVMESIFIISLVIIGGAGTLWGPIVGSVVLVVIPEALRFFGLPSSAAANVRQILYGGLLVAFVMIRPQGLMGNRAFGKGETSE